MDILHIITIIFTSVIYYAIIRKLTLLKVDKLIQLLFSFTIPIFIFLLINLSNSQNLFPNNFPFLQLIFSSIIFSWTASYISMKAMEISPNAGISVLISKSYPILTTTYALLFLKIPMTAIQVIGLVIIFSMIIAFALDDTKGKIKEIKSNGWIFLSLIPLILWAGLNLSMRDMVINGSKTELLLFYLFITITIFTLGQIYFKKINIINSVSRENLKFLIFAGISCAAFNFFLFNANKFISNPGIINITNTSSNVFLIFANALFFKDAISRRKVLISVIIVLGLAMLIIK